MKNLMIITLSLILGCGLSLQASEAPAYIIESTNAIGNWVKLGSKKVNYGLDRDEIYVTAKDGLFSAIKLKVRKAPINLHKCVIHFGNGKKQEVNIRKNIAKGGTTRVIDIDGGRRVIKKVVFWYDTKNLARKRGTLELHGRR